MQTERILKNLEFVDAGYCFTRENELSASTSYEEFLGYVSRKSYLYPNLKTYLDTYNDRIDYGYTYTIDEFEHEAQENMKEGELV